MSRLVDRDKVLAVVGPCFSGPFETIAPQLDSRFKTAIDLLLLGEDRTVSR
jgi:hypothetical protein